MSATICSGISFRMNDGDMSWHEIEDSNMVKFSFDYPENWKSNKYRVFYIGTNF